MRILTSLIGFANNDLEVTPLSADVFFKWGIQFEDAYSISEKSERMVQYADSRQMESAVLERFPPKKEAIRSSKPVPMEFMDGFEEMNEETVFRKRPPKTRKRE